MIQVEAREDLEVFAELAAWWNAQPGPAASVFLRSEWFATLAAGVAEGPGRLWTLVAFDDAGPVAALPMVKVGRRLRSLATGSTELFDVVHDGSGAGIEEITAELARHPVVHLHAAAAATPLVVERRRGPEWVPTKEARTGVVVLPTSTDALLVDLGRSLRSNVRRGWRALSDLGEVRVVLGPSGTEAHELLADGLALEAAGWKGREGRATTSDPDLAAGVARIVALGERMEWLRLGGLYVDDVLVAFNLDLEYAGRICGLVTAYDESLPARCSPGQVLLWRTLDDAIVRGVGAYELGGVGGRNAWKLQWPVVVEERLYWIGFGSGLPGRLARSLWARTHGTSMVRPDPPQGRHR